MFYVYLITNAVNGKKYVGRTNDPKTRWYAHRNNANRCSRGERVPAINPVHYAMAKYGLEVFTFEVIETCATEDEVRAAEMRWVAKLKTSIPTHGPEFGYNLTDGGEGCLGRRGTPEENARKSAASKGRQPTEETRARMSASQKRLNEDPKNRERLREMAIACKEHVQPILQAAARAWRADPANRLRMGDHSRGKKISPNIVARRAEGVRIAWQDPRLRAEASERMRRRWSEKPIDFTPEVREKMRAAKLGKTRFLPEQIAEMRMLYLEEGKSIRHIAAKFGCDHKTVGRLTGINPGRGSEATRERISAKLTGRKLSEEHRRKSATTLAIANQSRAKISFEIARSIRTEHSAGNVTGRILAVKYGLSPSMISQIVQNKSWPEPVSSDGEMQ